MILTADQLRRSLHNAFGYTEDNNRDLLGDELFPMAEVIEELEVQRAYQFLSAYIARNEKMINSNLEDEEI